MPVVARARFMEDVMYRVIEGLMVGSLLVSSGLFAGCSDDVVGPANAHPLLRTDVTADATWLRIERPGFGGGTGFSFSLPPGFEEVDLQPIDSDAAKYARGEASLSFDFGPHTARPRAPSEGATVQQRVGIGGRVADVLTHTAVDGRTVVVAWWRDAGRGSLGANHLLLRAEFDGGGDREELLAAIYSVRFE